MIEAVQWTGYFLKVKAVFGQDPAFEMIAHYDDGDALIINTLEGQMTALPGDWIIRGVKGEIYPCKPDIFASTYERA